MNVHVHVRAMLAVDVFMFLVGTFIIHSCFMNHKCTNLEIHAQAFTPDNSYTLSQSQSQSRLDLVALEALYNSTNGAHWMYLYDGRPGLMHYGRWFESEDVCSWYGVLCNDQNRVQTITLEVSHKLHAFLSWRYHW